MQAPAIAFTNVRAPAMPSSSLAVGLLGAAAALPVLQWGLGWLRIGIPYGNYLSMALSLVAIIVVLVFLHGAFTALRGRAHYSPGMAVGGWFIPIANFVIPALVLRDGWRASVGRGGGIAFLWMIAWWITTTINVLEGAGLQFASFDKGPVNVMLGDLEMFEVPVVPFEAFVFAYNLVAVGANVAAYGLLALIVHRIGRGPG
jgi:hypothetical protein